jgi:hypothetical protein
VIDIGFQSAFYDFIWLALALQILAIVVFLMLKRVRRRVFRSISFRRVGVLTSQRRRSSDQQSPGV